MNSFSRLIKPRLPSAALGLTGEGVAVVSLDRRRDRTLLMRRAGYVPLAEGLVRPNFDEPNVADVGELAAVVQGLAASAGVQKNKRWSVALPEAATRTTILTMDGGAGASRAETEEMLRWKTERGFGTPVEELRVARERLRPDAQGRPRYLATAVRLSVLAEYEETLATLGWQAGLILPRHMGEAWWLMREGVTAEASDSLLVSTHHEGFTAVLLRRAQPLLVRSIVCEAEDRVDELYRFLLFYRDRVQTPSLDADAPAADTIGRMMIAGDGIEHAEASAIIEETLNTRPRLVTATDVRLALPSNELDFDAIAAPAGLAALAWA
jgi:hypothetical protein